MTSFERCRPSLLTNQKSEKENMDKEDKVLLGTLIAFGLLGILTAITFFIIQIVRAAEL
jgi:hypothetical protein